MVLNGNARREFHVPHPKNTCENVAFYNACRGYYNLTEHIPFFLFHFVLARESSPCVAGLVGIVFGVGRILYSKAYAYQGPAFRGTGFALSTMSSMALLGVAVLNSDLFPF